MSISHVIVLSIGTVFGLIIFRALVSIFFGYLTGIFKDSVRYELDCSVVREVRPAHHGLHENCMSNCDCRRTAPKCSPWGSRMHRSRRARRTSTTSCRQKPDGKEDGGRAYWTKPLKGIVYKVLDYATEEVVKSIAKLVLEDVLDRDILSILPF